MVALSSFPVAAVSRDSAMETAPRVDITCATDEPTPLAPSPHLLREAKQLREAKKLHEAEQGGNGAGRPAALRPPQAVAQDETPRNLPLVVEALLLAAEEPPTISHLARATNVSPDAIEEALEALERAGRERGVRLQRSGASARLVTAPEAAPFVERLLGLERPNRLSRAALETLAIIAYQQPVTRAGIEAVRGVLCDAPLATLRDRDLIQPLGHAEGPGQAILWGTTSRFLEHFGLPRLVDLPPLPPAATPTEQGALALQEALRRGPRPSPPAVPVPLAGQEADGQRRYQPQGMAVASGD